MVVKCVRSRKVRVQLPQKYTESTIVNCHNGAGDKHTAGHCMGQGSTVQDNTVRCCTVQNIIMRV